MRTLRKYLVVRAGGEVRIIQRGRTLSLRMDEVAFPLTVNIPDSWGQVQPQEITVTLPEQPPTALVEAAG